MASCNENIIKNMASEITRNCQQQYGINVEIEFVVYLIELLLLNPKYGNLFTKTINRNNLEFFVNECVAMLKRGETSMNTLKIQFIMLSNYDKPQNLVDKRQDSIESCLRPLLEEIRDACPEPEDEGSLRKLHRKLSVYIILCSGLGNPAHVMNLKEGMAALQSVFSLEDLATFVSVPRTERKGRLDELVETVSGVRLFNRDCRKGGEMIPDLPLDLVSACAACHAALSHALAATQRRAHALTAAVEGCVRTHGETGNVQLHVPVDSEVTIEEYKQVMELLVFSRQYELTLRRLLEDVGWLTEVAEDQVVRVKEALEEIHAAVKYKSAVPVDTVFPLFARLWRLWRAMQNVMYLVSTVNRISAVLGGVQEHARIPYDTVDKMIGGKTVLSDQERMTSRVSLEERLSLTSLDNVVRPGCGCEIDLMNNRDVQFNGFCAVCLIAGALVPANLSLGLVRHRGRRYGLCSVAMATVFSRDPQRYVNEALDFVRNNPQFINLLNLRGQIEEVRDVVTLTLEYLPKIKVSTREVQTEVHPVEEYIDRNYSSDLYEWKRRACQWATIAQCRTHSTQTPYSHLRSEAHCQTVEMRDKGYQTKKDQGMNTNECSQFLWGLRGHLGDGAHSIDTVPPHAHDRLTPKPMSLCHCPGPSPTTGEGNDLSDTLAV